MQKDLLADPLLLADCTQEAQKDPAPPLHVGGGVREEVVIWPICPLWRAPNYRDSMEGRANTLEPH